MSTAIARSVARGARSRAGAARALSSSRWSAVEMGPADPILGVSQAYQADTSPKKLNLGVGAYRDDTGKPVVLPSVAEAQRRVLAATTENEYAPIGGYPAFVAAALKLAYEDCAPLAEGRVVGLQSLSGTGSLRVLGEYMHKFAPGMEVHLPNPTWGNHFPIFGNAGVKTHKYRYYDAKTRGLDLAGMLEDIRAAKPNSAIVLHACAHNPTGVDPTIEQWKQISDVCKERGHFVVFDSAYQGFASGSPTRDSAAVHLFVNEGHQIALSQSFAKNFGLYGHRVGVLSLITDSPEEAKRVESQVKIVARAMYSSPPIYGARVVTTVLEDDGLREQWYDDVRGMAERIITMREMLVANLKSCGSQHDWSHVTSQIGMFCFSGMTPEQVEKIVAKHHVYLTSNGRISMAGVTSENVGYLAEAVHDVTK